jgi:hypothetical protein
MKHGLALVLVGGLALVWSCSDETTTANSNNLASDGGTSSGGGGGGGDSGGAAGVECTHPGAGKSLGGDRCECTTARNIAGEWSTKRTCREGDACTTRDREERVVLTQEGTKVRADRGDTYSMSGTICGDFLVWNGGPKDGLNPECGQLKFTDDSHFLSDSCYVASGECARSHSQGCPAQKGQCTGTGAKMPDTAANIQKLLCN